MSGVFTLFVIFYYIFNVMYYVILPILISCGIMLVAYSFVCGVEYMYCLWHKQSNLDVNPGDKT